VYTVRHRQRVAHPPVHAPSGLTDVHF